MLSCLVGAYVTANPASRLEAVVAAIAGEGLAGQIAAARMGELDGNGSFPHLPARRYLQHDRRALAAGRSWRSSRGAAPLQPRQGGHAPARPAVPEGQCQRPLATRPFGQPYDAEGIAIERRFVHGTSPRALERPGHPYAMRLYAVTDRAWLNGRTLPELVADAIAGGATFIQLREKHATHDERI